MIRMDAAISRRNLILFKMIDIYAKPIRNPPLIRKNQKNRYRNHYSMYNNFCKRRKREQSHYTSIIF